MFAFRGSRGPVEVGFTDRTGGVSQGSFSSLNLAQHGLDAGDLVAENLRRVAQAFAGDPEAPLALMDQVHGAEVAVVDAGTDASAPPRVDGLVTARAGLTLVVRVADCVPVLLADPERGLVAALHAGRPGLVAGVVPRGVEALRDLGAQRLVAWLGPSVCGRCYEVPEQMRADVSAVVPEAWAETSWGTAAVDVAAGVSAQLRAAGAEVIDVARCTRESEDLYSYRRDGAQAGRLAGVVRVRG